ncbi:hypothetical protein NPIL_320691 [Nephila pilipes]|uniref:Uncharacterized protein n=1 Tax=Nephila pilipes TaxID=299642 RepID=A0A8X6TFP4_NEPPI|nr:hypothetical protein NPIL_320691 [Nephila pilipes]
MGDRGHSNIIYKLSPKQFVLHYPKLKGFSIFHRSFLIKMSEEAQPSASPVVDPEASPTEKPSERAQCSIEVSNSPESPTGGDSSSLLETPPEMHAFEIGFPTPPASPEHRFHKKRQRQQWLSDRQGRKPRCRCLSSNTDSTQIRCALVVDEDLARRQWLSGRQDRKPRCRCCLRSNTDSPHTRYVLVVDEELAVSIALPLLGAAIYFVV